jgi:hypothetical protein
MKKITKSNSYWLIYKERGGIIAVFLLFFNVICLAQSISITGKVTDNTGEPIIGANIMVQGTKLGAVTDLEGKYSLINISSNATLSISYVGFSTQVLKISGRSVINIVLKEDSKTLDELVVVGYGQMRKSDLTGAMSTVTSKNHSRTSSAECFTSYTR